MVKFEAMKHMNPKSLSKFVLSCALISSLSGCVYDRYLDRSARAQSSSAPTQTVAARPAAQKVVMQVDASRYYSDLEYRHVTVQRGDTLSMIADRNGVPLSAVLALNNAKPPYYIYAGQLIKVPQFRQHRVAGGETLYAISRVYDVEVAEVVHFNFMQPPYELRPGDMVKIPAKNGGQTRVAAVGPAAWSVAGEQKSEPVMTNTAQARATSKTVTSTELSAPPVPAQRQNVVNNTPLPRADKPVQVASIEPRVLAAPTAPAAQSSPVVSEPATPVLQGREIPADALPPLPKQRYSIKRPPSRDGARFAWPASGQIISGYGKKDSGFHNDGINIKLAPGTPVRAAENGVVSYVGRGMRSFGNLILISHADGYVTTYGHVASIHVYKGQPVQKGDVIASSGASGDVSVPQLHFEVRKDGTAKNPMTVLASR